MNDKAILEGKRVVPVEDFLMWADWVQKNTHLRIVRRDRWKDAFVSTVFLGLDHSFGGKKHLWFETMVFGGPLDGEMDRYETWEEAEAGHDRILRKLMGDQ
jgi:hypothetical protein